MKKKLLLLLFFCTAISGYAQADNYALKLTGNGQVNCGSIDGLEGASTFTLETWIYVDNWTQGASIAQYGDNISIGLGTEVAGELKVAISNGEGKQTATISAGIQKEKWHLLTIVFQGETNDKLTVFVDAQPVIVDNASALPASTLPATATFTIGKGFDGRIDEIRLWKKALTQEEILLKSTISPFHDSYGELLGYWKCDQFTSPGLVDYSDGAHHGSFDTATRELVKDNTMFWYRPITSYVGLGQVAQGVIYDNLQLMMCNDIALFGLSFNANTGDVSWAYPDYPTKLTDVGYATTFTAPKTPEGDYLAHDNNGLSRVTRNNILKFNGEGAQFEIESLSLGANKSTFHTWLYLNEWKEGVALFEKKNAAGDEISLKAGKNDGEFIFTVSAMVSGTRYTEVYPFDNFCIDVEEPTRKLTTQLTGDQQYWHFLSFTFNNNAVGAPVSICLDGFIQGWLPGGPKMVTFSDVTKVLSNGKPMDVNKKGELQPKIKTLPTFAGNMIVGKNLDGYMDEIAFWAIDRTASQRWRGDALDAGLGLGVKGVYYTIQSLQAYYRSNEVDNPAKSEVSFKGLLDIMLDKLKDYRGYKLRMAVTTSGGDWVSMMRDKPAIRDKAAVNLATELKDSPFYKFSGLDLDLEWASGDCQVGYGLFLKKLREELGPDALISVATNGAMWGSFALTQDAMDATDYFTSQDYGPFFGKFQWENGSNGFLDMQRNYKAGNLPTYKLMPSYGAYAVGDEKLGNPGGFDSTGYKAFADKVTNPDEERILRSAATETAPETWYNFTGMNQVRKRTKYVLDNDCYGLMYFDIACDVLPTHEKSLTRAMAQVLASNNEKIVEVADPGLSSIHQTALNEGLKFYPSPAKSGSTITLTGTDAKELMIYDIVGKLVQASPLTNNEVKLDLAPGIYVIKAGKESKQLIVTE